MKVSANLPQAEVWNYHEALKFTFPEKSYLPKFNKFSRITSYFDFSDYWGIFVLLHLKCMNTKSYLCICYFGYIHLLKTNWIRKRTQRYDIPVKIDYNFNMTLDNFRLIKLLGKNVSVYMSVGLKSLDWYFGNLKYTNMKFSGGCDAVSLGGKLPNFRRILMPLSSG
jgi:hypothetical protein